MELCKHDRHKVIDWIKDPKWITQEVLINTQAIDPNIEHYIIQFSNDKAIHNFSDVSAKEKYGWFYMSGKMIRRHKTIANGGGKVYVVPLDKREEFIPIKNCEHEER